MWRRSRLFPVRSWVVICAAHTCQSTRCFLTFLPLLWQPPGVRSNGRAAALAPYIGVYQFIKFGGGFFAGTAVFLLDLLVLAFGRFRKDQFGRWLRSGLTTLAAFAVVEGFRCGTAAALLPAAVRGT